MITKTRLPHLLTISLALFMARPALAIDSVSLELGAADQAQIARVGLQSQWQSQWWQSNGTHIGGYWDMTLAQWRGMRFRGQNDVHQNITDIGITPVLRFQADSKKGLFAEVGIGAHLLSDLYDNDGRQFSTRFQFGDHIGIGYVMQNRLTVSLSVQHFSNARIKQPNPGILFGVAKVAYAF
ncbi:MAG: acyloxyacyl hydrolase [Undibacterium sp.]|uniref:acyloxyacyl hydrolase n=1 Tax=Undibacterium sp. TaxID=1914977 RepID=UPI0027176A07|nr:acyloxyacyl hydrolase [Undibacterium sp.]MDO8651899.1 acyloxyacyl hydrolase [Undibacterium sp.]